MAKKKFNLMDEDLVGVIAGAQETKTQQAPVPASTAAPAPEAVPAPAAEAPRRRTDDPRVAFGISLKGSVKKKIEMCAVVKRTNTSQIVADALREYFERHPDLIQKYEKMEQLGLLD